MVVPGRGQTHNNITLTDGNNELHGSIVAPSGPGWDWTSKPGLWIPIEYRYSNRTLAVRAQIDLAAAAHLGLSPAFGAEVAVTRNNSCTAYGYTSLERFRLDERGS